MEKEPVIYADAFVTLDHELYKQLDEADFDYIRSCKIAIDGTKEKFEQPVLHGDLSQLSKLKCWLQQKYFPGTIEKCTVKKRQCDLKQQDTPTEAYLPTKKQLVQTSKDKQDGACEQKVEVKKRPECSKKGAEQIWRSRKHEEKHTVKEDLGVNCFSGTNNPIHARSDCHKKAFSIAAQDEVTGTGNTSDLDTLFEGIQGMSLLQGQPRPSQIHSNTGDVPPSFHIVKRDIPDNIHFSSQVENKEEFTTKCPNMQENKPSHMNGSQRSMTSATNDANYNDGGATETRDAYTTDEKKTGFEGEEPEENIHRHLSEINCKESRSDLCLKPQVAENKSDGWSFLESQPPGARQHLLQQNKLSLVAAGHQTNMLPPAQDATGDGAGEFKDANGTAEEADERKGRESQPACPNYQSDITGNDNTCTPNTHDHVSSSWSFLEAPQTIAGQEQGTSIGGADDPLNTIRNEPASTERANSATERSHAPSLKSRCLFDEPIGKPLSELIDVTGNTTESDTEALQNLTETNKITDSVDVANIEPQQNQNTGGNIREASHPETSLHGLHQEKSTLSLMAPRQHTEASFPNPASDRPDNGKTGGDTKGRSHREPCDGIPAIDHQYITPGTTEDEKQTHLMTGSENSINEAGEDSPQYTDENQLNDVYHGTRPKVNPGRQAETPCASSFVTNRYLWLWYKHRNEVHLARTASKYHCSINEKLIKQNSKNVAIFAQSDWGISKDGQLEVEKCMDEITQALIYIQDKHCIVHRPISQYDSKRLANIKLPDYIYICDDINKGTVIVGVSEKAVQALFDELGPSLSNEKIRVSPDARSDTMESVGDQNLLNDDEDQNLLTNDEEKDSKSTTTEEIENFITMDYRLFKYIGKVRLAALRSIREKYGVECTLLTTDIGHGVKLTGFPMGVSGASFEIGKLLSEMDVVIKEDVIDVSGVSDKPLVSRVVKDMTENYEVVVFKYKEDTIRLFGDEDHIRQAKRKLQYKLGMMENSIDRPPTRDSKPPTTGPASPHQQQPALKKRRELVQPSPSPPVVEYVIGASFVTRNSKKIHIFMGDITKLCVGAVVNASNTKLEHGEGVAGAISKVAGPKLQEECTRIIKQKGPLRTSDTYTSEPYEMPCQCIIHVAGPRWTDIKDKEKAVACLGASFLNVLAEADRQNLPSIAIPAVGSGIYGAPLEIVAQSMFDAVTTFLKRTCAGTKVHDILLVDINREILELLTLHYEQAVFQGVMKSIPTDYDRFISRREHKYKRDGSQEKPNTAGNSQFYRSSLAGAAKCGSSDKAHGSRSAPTVTPNPGPHVRKRTYAESMRTTPVSPVSEDAQASQGQLVPTAEAAVPREPRKEEVNCAICMETPTYQVTLSICKHVFCKVCIDTWFKKKPTCPVCGKIHGEMKGDQPDGTMTTSRLPTNLPGYDKCRGTIVIYYNFPGGMQNAVHPNPGRPYQGTSRTAYLPETREARAVLALLRRAFDAGLTFTIGRSTTTGLEGQITWNDIHHKTNTTGGPARFGYPDATYLRRVKEELAAKGIQ